MSESNYSVYVHTSPCGKKYVGITKQNPIDRWKKGKAYPSNKYFTEEIEKYGWDNFQHEIVAEKLSKADAEAMEIKLIKEFKSDNKEFGYNITKGGAPCNRGYSDEDRRKARRESERKWKENSREKYLAYRREYDRSEKRKEYVNALNKTEKRRKHRTEYMRKYREANREKIREISRRSEEKRKRNGDTSRYETEEKSPQTDGEVVC